MRERTQALGANGEAKWTGDDEDASSATSATVGGSQLSGVRHGRLVGITGIIRVCGERTAARW